MVGQFVARVLGLAGIIAGSQAPGYTLQYMQNLAGRVDELSAVVGQYDAVAADLGMDRATYIADLREGGAAARGTADVVQSTADRLARLRAHFEYLESADPFRRPLLMARDLEEDVARSTLENFEWTAPLSPEGAVYGIGGGAVLWGAPAALFGLIGGLFGGGRRRYV